MSNAANKLEAPANAANGGPPALAASAAAERGANRQAIPKQHFGVAKKGYDAAVHKHGAPLRRGPAPVSISLGSGAQPSSGRTAAPAALTSSGTCMDSMLTSAGASAMTNRVGRPRGSSMRLVTAAPLQPMGGPANSEASGLAWPLHASAIIGTTNDDDADSGSGADSDGCPSVCQNIPPASKRLRTSAGSGAVLAAEPSEVESGVVSYGCRGQQQAGRSRMVSEALTSAGGDTCATADFWFRPPSGARPMPRIALPAFAPSETTAIDGECEPGDEAGTIAATAVTALKTGTRPMLPAAQLEDGGAAGTQPQLAVSSGPISLSAATNLVSNRWGGLLPWRGGARSGRTRGAASAGGPRAGGGGGRALSGTSAMLGRAVSQQVSSAGRADDDCSDDALSSMRRVVEDRAVADPIVPIAPAPLLSLPLPPVAAAASPDASAEPAHALQAPRAPFLLDDPLEGVPWSGPPEERPYYYQSRYEQLLHGINLVPAPLRGPWEDEE